MSSSASYLDPIILPLIQGAAVLDIGCGWGRWGNLIRTNYWEANLKFPPKVDGCDIFFDNTRICKSQPSYRYVWQTRMPAQLKKKWDTVIACEIIEHLPAYQTDSFLKMIESAANKRVILSTPNWPYLRGQGGSVNPYEAHLSYVSANYLKKKGYTLIGAGFGNPESKFVKYALRFNKNLKTTLQSVSRLFINTAIMVVAYKDI